MTIFKQMLMTHLERKYLAEGNRVHTVGVQVVLFVSLILCSTGSAQDEPGGNYTRTSQPAMLSYQELVALGEETVDPALDAKLHTLLTTPFVNNEAFFNGTNRFGPISRVWGLRCAWWSGISSGESNSTRSG